MSKPGVRNLFALLALVVAAAVVSGCAKPAPRCTSPEDNPPHHYLRGMELLDDEKVEDAEQRFARAVWCDETYGPGYSGLALVEAMRAGAQDDPDYREVDATRAMEDLDRAWDEASNHEDEFVYRLASMRVHTDIKPRKWLRQVEHDYRKAMGLKVDPDNLPYYRGREAGPYFMGLAYMEGGEFTAARDRFREVLDMADTGRWAGRADRMWAKTDDMVRATAGATIGEVGREIAMKDSIRRDDLAALLVDELRIDTLFAGRLSGEKPEPVEFTPADVAENPFRDEIMTLLKWDVRGLEAVYDPGQRAYLYRPERPVTRKELALVLEDVIIKLTGDEDLATEFYGHRSSPFPDVPPTSAWYNAVMNVTTRSIMETDISGEFRPEEVVTGSEAILAVRVLKRRLGTE